MLAKFRENFLPFRNRLSVRNTPELSTNQVIDRKELPINICDFFDCLMERRNQWQKVQDDYVVVLDDELLDAFVNAKYFVHNAIMDPFLEIRGLGGKGDKISWPQKLRLT